MKNLPIRYLLLVGTARRIIDLSLLIDNNMPGVKITQFSTIEGKGWNTTTLSLYSHCGIHMDAPKHFLPDVDGDGSPVRAIAIKENG